VEALNSEKAVWKPEMLKYITMYVKINTVQRQYRENKQGSEFQQHVQITHLVTASKVSENYGQLITGTKGSGWRHVDKYNKLSVLQEIQLHTV
jgi:hypothetical protein